LVQVTIVSQPYPSVKISNRKSTADARSDAGVPDRIREPVRAGRLHVADAGMIRCGWRPFWRALRSP